MRDYGNWSTMLTFHNQGITPAIAILRYYDVDGILVYSTTTHLTSHGLITQALNQGESLPVGFFGTLTVESDVPLVIQAETVSGTLSMSYRGESAGAQVIWVPSIITDTSNYLNSGFTVGNTGPITASVWMRYYNRQGLELSVVSDTIPPNGLGLYFPQRISGLGNEFSGGIAVTATQPIIVNAQKYRNIASLPTLPSHQWPHADFNAWPKQGIAPMTVVFTDTSTGDTTSWLWSFGDGITSAIAGPTHTYGTAGIYTVSLTVLGPSGSSISTRGSYITVNNSSSNITRSLQMWPIAATASGLAGTDVIYTLTLSNTGGVADIYSVSVVSQWAASTSISSTSQQPLTNNVFNVRVTIPSDANGGALNQAQVIAQSLISPTVKASVLLTTVAYGQATHYTRGWLAGLHRYPKRPNGCANWGGRRQ